MIIPPVQDTTVFFIAIVNSLVIVIGTLGLVIRHLILKRRESNGNNPHPHINYCNSVHNELNKSINKLVDKETYREDYKILASAQKEILEKLSRHSEEIGIIKSDLKTHINQDRQKE